MPNVVVEAHGLSRHFGQLVAVNNVSFQILRGEIFGLLGPNGSGKSTIIRMLCGVLEPTAGDATVLGCDIPREAEATQASHRLHVAKLRPLYRLVRARES